MSADRPGEAPAQSTGPGTGWWRARRAAVGERPGRAGWLLLGMAAITGLVDATSFLGLGSVFVANMTGNVVLLAFALAGAPGLSADLSVSALAGFLTGAALAGRLGRAPRLAEPGRRLLVVTVGLQDVLIGAALLDSAITRQVDGRGGSSGAQGRPYVVVVLLALAMGLQHATARRVALPQVPTNVLTSTLTGLVVDSRLAGGAGFRGPRRLAAPLVMFGGALVGAVCLLHVHRLLALAIATALAAGCLIAAATGLVTVDNTGDGG